MHTLAGLLNNYKLPNIVISTQNAILFVTFNTQYVVKSPVSITSKDMTVASN